MVNGCGPGVIVAGSEPPAISVMFENPRGAFERPFLTVASYGLRRFHLYREATLVARSLQHLASNRRSDRRGRGR